MDLHLRIKLRPGGRPSFDEFLARATPHYESPGGIRIELLEDLSDEERLIEVVHYATREDYERDQARVETDPQMHSLLAEWRGLLAEPPVVEAYSTP